MTGEIKKICIEVLQKIVGDFQKRRSEVSDETVKYFMDSSRKIEPQTLYIRTILIKRNNIKARMNGHKDALECSIRESVNKCLFMHAFIGANVDWCLTSDDT